MLILQLVQTNVAIVIAMALVYTVIIILVQRKITDPKVIMEAQKEIKRLTDELGALTKNNAPQQEIMAKQAELMPHLNGQIKNQFKSLFVVIPLYLVVYYYLLPSIPLGFPTIKAEQSLFFWTSALIGIIYAIAFSIYQKRKMKQEQVSQAVKSAEA